MQAQKSKSQFNQFGQQEALNQIGLLQQIANFFSSQKQLITYSVLVDSTSIDQALKSLTDQSPQQVNKLQSQRARLLQTYRTAIQRYDELCTKAQLQQVEKMIVQNNQQVMKQQEQFVNFLLPELQNIQSQLKNELKSSLEGMKTYLETLASRIKHQKYLNDQKRINQYVQKQKICVKEKQKTIVNIIQERNKKIEQMVKAAKSVCAQKQKRIDKLTKSNQNNQKALQQTSKSLSQYCQKQKQMYDSVTILGQEILAIKAQKKKKWPIVNQRKLEGSQVFKNRNLGSQIVEEGSSIQQKQSAVFFPTEGQSKSRRKCQVESPGFASQFYSQRFAILGLFVLSMILSLW